MNETVTDNVRLKDDFAGSDYRLGNIIDRWFVFHMCRNMHCNKHVVQKFWLELEEMTTRAPEFSIATFLMQNSPGQMTLPLHFKDSFNQSVFAQHYEWFWIYSYDAVKEVYDVFRSTLSDNLQQYAELGLVSGHFRPIYFGVHTCVVHYRLGDMLSHSHFLDPVDFAHQLFHWKLMLSLDIRTIYVLTAGGISFRATSSEINVSMSLLYTFLNATRELFPIAKLVTVADGTPDEDWMKMVMSPMLFTSHGSYAISAAALNTGYRGTPAIVNSNFPGCGSRVPGYIVPRWYLFPCKNYRP